MSITKANLLSFANVALDAEYSGTQLDEAIKLVLDDLSKLHALLAEDTSQSLVTDDRYLEYPSDALETDQAIKSVTLTGTGNVLYDSLRYLPGGWDAYQSLMEYHNTANNGVPRYRVIHDKRMYLWPPPDGAYSASIWYYKLHQDISLGIEFDDNWATAIKYGTVSFWAMLKSSADLMAIWEPRYREERERCRLRVPRETEIEGA